MAFRADEAAADRLAKTKNYLIPRTFSTELRGRAEKVFNEVVEQCGPAVDDYPSWHPIVSGHEDQRNPHTTPGRAQGYVGLDHTRYFAHGFVTCPYGDGQVVFDSVRQLNQKLMRRGWLASITAEGLDCTFYNEGTTPILVRCEWESELEENHTIPKRVAVALMLEHELPHWRSAEVGETWETMHPYLLGSPHGKRSSLFVTQETALAMKKVYAALNEAGVFGPMYHRE